ncbi:ribose-phosphate pyrophosphokinase [Oceanospirillum linum]|uniref:ribose-phosphate diphosphokinase n=1 Tax=Oceanospirillum linum TaxID=966 RepID=A0A1T1HE87_OCELI|nr:ribose-phosphate pyrophosphokinase [Oceanospirillum linum]OOV88050.1 phosphoribosylpyrophosphate synthetase [Oceanospirillum linum]SEF41370.1 ribose-phosphate pyrophosphokinase [Oleiphilus messinensis]SMP00689.1 ribose-phosphate pyrophosphokinase [Oceanospirillum linum]
MTPILFDLNDASSLKAGLTQQLNAEEGQLNQRRFPDGESYLQVITPVKDRVTLILCTLYQPDEKFLPLIYLAETLKEMGARQVVLIAPYLAYMRQDKRFHEGECITSIYFARLISQSFDHLITVDPHLHRYHSLDEIYTIPSQVVASAKSVARWISREVERPLLIGPDIESEQWVAEVAQLANAPFEVLLKERHGDRDVSVSLPHVERYQQHTPVLVDDIISSGRTMIETIQHLQVAGMQKAVCIGTHGLFADQAYQQIQKAHVEKVITCNTVCHISNGIDMAPDLAGAVQNILTEQ